METSRVCRAVAVVLMAVFSVALFRAPPVVGQSSAAGQRLERLTQLGGPVRAAVLDGVDALVAEGDSIVRVPLLGPNAYQATERLTLAYGPILDLARTVRALYALTGSHLVILTPDGRVVRQVMSGGGERLNLADGLVVIASRQAGARLFAIAADGSLGEMQRIVSPTETTQGVIITASLLAMADGAAGLRLIGLENPATFRPVSTLAELTPANGVASFASWVYVRANHRLHILDTTPPLPPRQLGYYLPIHDVRELAWHNGFILVADAGDGLKVYSFDTQGSPRYVYSQQATSAYHVAADPRGEVILSAQLNGVSIFSARHLPELRLLSFVPLWEAPTSITLTRDGLALVALGPGGLAIIDIGVPTYPRVIAALPFAGPLQHVLPHPVYPSVLYLTFSDGRLMTIGFDAAMPQSIAVYSDIALSGEPMRLAHDEGGRTLAVATGRAGLQFFSLLTPTQPQPLAILPAQTLGSSGITRVGYMRGQQWVTLDGQTVRLLTLRGDHIQERSRLDVQDANTMSVVADEVVTGGANRLAVLSTSRYQLLAQTTYQAPATLTDMRTLLGQVVLAGGQAGLVILDTSNPAAPREQRFIQTPIPAERVLVEGDDLLVTSPQAGFVHLRFPVLMADRVDIQPAIAGIYRPVQAIQDLVPLANGRLGLIGQGWSAWQQGQIVRLNDRHGVAGVAFGDGAILLDENGTPYRVNNFGQVTTENKQVSGGALATNGVDRVWLLSANGNLHTLAADTLLPVAPIATLGFTSPPNVLVYIVDRLIAGTQGGELWSIGLAPAPQATRLMQNLGGAIADIQVTGGAQILVSTSAGGLWWIDNSSPAIGQVIAHHRGTALAAALDVTGQWLALAAGQCGLQVFAVSQPPSLTFFAGWDGGFVSDVRFIDQGLLAIVDGSPVLFAFDPRRPADAPPVPRYPLPLHNAEIATQMLRWKGVAQGCRPMIYEVWLNGALAGRTTDTSWRLAEPIRQDLRWQIVAVDGQGNRTSGPVWQVYAPLTGWAGMPPMLQMKPERPQRDKQSPSLWRVLGMVFVTLGALGLVSVLWRQFSGSRLPPGLPPSSFWGEGRP